MATLRGHCGLIHASAFAPDGALLATGGGYAPSTGVSKSESSATMVWDLTALRPAVTLHWHREPVLAVAFSPGNQYLATGSGDRTIALWNVERGLWNLVMGAHDRSLRAHDAAVTSLAFRPDGSLLASAGADGAVKLWNTSDWRQAALFNAARNGDARILFSPCGKYLAGVWRSRGPAIVWDVAAGKEHLELRLWTSEDSEDYGLAFSPDGAKLAVLSTGEVRIWDLATCQVIASFTSLGSLTIAYSPRGNLLATGGWDQETQAAVSLWDASTGVLVGQFGGHAQPVETICFSHDGGRLASGGRDGVVNLWEVP
ncbi:MAG TPA: WD40 repeat domain-containing protein [Pirellulales bacterium]|nr:WD40 repeat domain-containing protein [Pirellulales bacterium]